jgi:Domain of unknown function (DUF1995)
MLCKAAGIPLHRILRAYPGDWQVHLVNEGTGEAALVTTLPQRPSYRELEALIRCHPSVVLKERDVRAVLSAAVSWLMSEGAEAPEHPGPC